MEEEKGKKKGNSKGKSIVKQTPGGDDIPCAVTLQLQTEMYPVVNSSANDVDTMVDDQQIVLPEQGQEMCNDTPLWQPPASAPPPHSPMRPP